MGYTARVNRAWAVVFLLASAAYGQRLPGGAHPEHYRLLLVPDIAAARFSGDETIDVVMDAPSNAITLNAADIKFQSVTADGAEATIANDVTKEQVTVTFPRRLAGRVSLHIAYTGVLNDKLRGFYLSRTPRRSYARGDAVWSRRMHGGRFRVSMSRR